MATGELRITGICGGKNITKQITKTFDHPNNYEGITLSAGKTVTDWVKTDENNAACTLPADHGYSSGKMSVFWEVDGVTGMRYDVDGVVDTNDLDLDGGTGDAFPDSATTGIIVCTHQQINTAIDGDNISMIVINAGGRASLYFEDSGGSEVAQTELAEDTPFVWHDTCGFTNPFTGNPITVCFATNGTAEDITLDIICGEDSTP